MVIECYFSTDDISKIISEQIFEAKKCILLAMYTLTDRGLINALKEKRQNGTDVLAIFDEDQLAKFSDIILELNNADIVFKTIGKEVARMHHKFLIIDDIKVITGSFNWTRQANKSNMENIMIVENQNIAKQYISEFDRIWQLISSRGIGNYLKDGADILIEDTKKKDDADIIIEDTEKKDNADIIIEDTEKMRKKVPPHTVKIETVQKSMTDRMIDNLAWVHKHKRP